MNDPVQPPLDIQQAMRSMIQRIATGPELSKDIDREEARLGMGAILRGQVDPIQAGIFLIALRMKRESDEELKGILDAVLDATAHVQAEVDEVVDIADPYDGYNRSLPPAPFLPALLAECGLPTVCHGLDAVGPKYGVTNRHVLSAAGLDIDPSSAQAARRLSDPELGWAYVDQRSFCPSLHDLVELRTKIVKRQALTTVEVLAKPIHGRVKTHLVTGYVHKPYPRIYALLARHAGFDSALFVRGVEGGVIPSLRQPGTCFHYHDLGEERPFDVDPAALGIDQEVRAVPLPETAAEAERAAGDAIGLAGDADTIARAAAEAGLAALEGRRGATYDALALGAALVLWHLGRASTLEAAADRARAVLDSGAACRRVA
jgi:anthranilate phosphoribosyltransferase